jgi:GNAT superfamily N-acetyltransferase
LQKSFLKAAE